MNYIEHYNKLILRGKTRGIKKSSTVYYELHHIVPKCLGGTNSDSNLVLLTPEEHFIAHKLLVKIYPNKGKLIYAVNMMCVGRNNKMYGWLKKKLQQVLKDDKERSDKISKSLTGRHVPDYIGRKISKSNKGRIISQSTREKISNSTKGVSKPTNFGKKISARLKGRKHNDLHHKKVIDSKLRNGTLLQSKSTKEKISNSLSKLKWYNNGTTNIRSSVNPGCDYVPGRLPIAKKKKINQKYDKVILDTSTLPKFKYDHYKKSNNGKRNGAWKGYIVTPDGIFESSMQAAIYYSLTDGTIRNRCLSDNPKFKEWVQLTNLGNENE